MTIYLLLFAFIALMAAIFYYPNSNKAQFNKVFTVLIFISLVLIIGLRHPSMGNDLKYGESNGYLGAFEVLSKMSWSEILKLEAFLNYERGFIIYCKLVSSIWNNHQFFLFISALLSIFPIFLTIYKKSENAIMSSLIYMGVPAFFIIFSGVRQGLAIGICFFAVLILLKERKSIYTIILFILIVLLAWTFHSSSIIFLLALPLYYIKFDKTSRWISVGILPIIYLGRNWLFSILSKLFKDDAVANDTGALTLLLVFVGIYVFCILFSSNNDREYNWYMNMFYIACVCQIFGGIFDTAMIVGYYFMLALVLLLPKLISDMKVKSNELLSQIGVNIAFGAYAIYSIYTSTWAMAYPHHFFWEII